MSSLLELAAQLVSSVNALIKAGFSVTVSQRRSSGSMPGKDDVNFIEIDDKFPSRDIEEAFEGQDACVIAIIPCDLDLNLRLADAVATAGIKRRIVADFGSYESSTPQGLKLLQLSEN
ncbi:hypothetical protein F5Y16DRAFT_402215 [Xylariaceae sp. FL0255]|nr:hypothetical protein F5Y16DRAFT_402215 [Xylariaceae sp. FL0255]